MQLCALVPDASAEHRSIEVSTVACDSREVLPGTLFFAIRGAKHDGSAFVADAVRKGAAAIVIESGREIPAISGRTPVIEVPNVRAAYSRAAAAVHSHPSSKLDCIGVTGTNGKTSVAWIISYALSTLGRRSAMLGTLGESIAGGAFEALENTTPDAATVQRFLARACESRCSAATLEATSQGIVQHRTSAVQWNAGVFTNLSRDHLDLHGTMEDYEAAKARFFTDELARSGKSNRLAVFNVDDEAGLRMYQLVKNNHPDIRAVSYALSRKADGRAENFNPAIDRSEFEATLFGEKITITSRLIGAFNVLNLLGAAACLTAYGFSAAEVARAFETVAPVPGRLEVLPAGGFHVVVDYAHTPDGLVKAQQSLRPLTRGRLITVFGCGGDRDRGKRPLMGGAVAELSDVGVLTSDNPRTEDPERIIDDIEPGLQTTAKRPGFVALREADRRKAISLALSEAKKGDVVLIAGKGHEDYQEIQGVRYPFSDQEICRTLLGSKA